MRSNPLDPIWRAYKISVGSFKMTNRVIKQQQVDLINNLPSPIDSSTLQEITQAQKEVEALFVFSLWATFERFVISYLQDKGQCH
jgi:glycerol-3-phosphate responsive antiterminator